MKLKTNIKKCCFCCYIASVVSDSVRAHRRQPTRLPHPWDSPGRNTGVGCHFLLQCMKVKSKSKVAQSCLTLCNPMDCSLQGSSIHGIFQARVLKWVAISFSIKKWYLINLKRFCMANGTINKMKRQPTEWDKIFANNAAIKGLSSKICKHLMRLNI